MKEIKTTKGIEDTLEKYGHSSNTTANLVAVGMDGWNGTERIEWSERETKIAICIEKTTFRNDCFQIRRIRLWASVFMRWLKNDSNSTVLLDQNRLNTKNFEKKNNNITTTRTHV